MTLAQQLKQEGLQQGLQQGIERGLEQGRHEEDLVIAKRMLARGYDHEAIKDLTALSDQDLLNLED